MLSRSRGSTLPLHLAAYVHPRAPALHVGYCLHPYTLYSGPPLKLPASTQRAAHRRGETSLLCTRDPSLTLNNSSRKLHHSPLPFPQVLVVDLCNSRFLRQVETTAKNLSATHVVTPPDVLWIQCVYSLQCVDSIYICVLPFTAGWWGLHSSPQAAGGSWARAGQEEGAGLWERRSAQWWLSTVITALWCTLFIQHNNIISEVTDT